MNKQEARMRLNQVFRDAHNPVVHEFLTQVVLFKKNHPLQSNEHKESIIRPIWVSECGLVVNIELAVDLQNMDAFNNVNVIEQDEAPEDCFNLIADRDYGITDHKDRAHVDLSGDIIEISLFHDALYRVTPDFSIQKIYYQVSQRLRIDLVRRTQKVFNRQNNKRLTMDALKDVLPLSRQNFMMFWNKVNWRAQNDIVFNEALEHSGLMQYYHKSHLFQESLYRFLALVQAYLIVPHIGSYYKDALFKDKLFDFITYAKPSKNKLVSASNEYLRNKNNLNQVLGIDSKWEPLLNVYYGTISFIEVTRINMWLKWFDKVIGITSNSMAEKIAYLILSHRKDTVSYESATRLAWLLKCGYNVDEISNFIYNNTTQVNAYTQDKEVALSKLYTFVRQDYALFGCIKHRFPESLKEDDLHHSLVKKTIKAVEKQGVEGLSQIHLHPRINDLCATQGDITITHIRDYSKHDELQVAQYELMRGTDYLVILCQGNENPPVEPIVVEINGYHLKPIKGVLAKYKNEVKAWKRKHNLISNTEDIDLRL